MKFFTAVLALATVAFAYPTVNMNAPVKRQNIVTADVSLPAMTDGAGNVVPFDAARVDQARRKA
ncbi:hypothetical protein QBC40DRAFT_250984 [Triangularia verruculosa]|uniref:Uncharacterized protein n=1 Tax=Triangularia verruculosa TaxID=2587418 RepID=A0AAN7B044_9PEZI|nr:hypothetical protein QBC40DRAFT_250984 [Triangularia verruculosa]